MRAFLGGRFVRPPQPGATALLVNDEGRIAAIGSDAEILARAGSSAETTDLGGGLLLPGFQDAHVHLAQLGRFLARPDLSCVQSLEEALAAVRRARDARKEGVLFLEGYDESAWPERRPPRREELDSIEPSRPLIVRRVCGHIAAANRAALEAIPEGTPGVDRASGLLEEEVVFRLESDFFPPTPSEIRDGILLGQKTAFSLGITTVHEVGYPSLAEAYRGLVKEGLLELRVFFFAVASPEEAARLRRDDETGPFRVAGAKAFLDGSIGGRTAALREPYLDGGEGILLLDPPEIRSLLRSAEAADIPVAFHAIGDRASGALLEAFEEGPGSAARLLHRIEHAEMLSDEDLARVRALGVRLSMQPNFMPRWGGAGGMYAERLGERRASSLNRIGSAIRRSIPVAFGSDCMPLDPFLGLSGAARHPVPGESVPWEAALFGYTRAAEGFVRGGGDAGALAPGLRADFALFDPGARLETLSRESLVRTVCRGEAVHERS
jgi:predicted amidohydrolase YtcJ